MPTRAIEEETGFTPGQIDRLHTRFKGFIFFFINFDETKATISFIKELLLGLTNMTHIVLKHLSMMCIVHITKKAFSFLFSQYVLCSSVFKKFNLKV